MTDFRTAQQRAYANKVAKGFNITDVPMEFGLLVEEIGEAFSTWRKQKPGLGGELADVAIFLFGLAEMTGVDLGAEVEAKLAANEGRSYVFLPNGTPVKAEATGTGDRPSSRRKITLATCPQCGTPVRRREWVTENGLGDFRRDSLLIHEDGSPACGATSPGGQFRVGAIEDEGAAPRLVISCQGCGDEETVSDEEGGCTLSDLAGWVEGHRHAPEAMTTTATAPRFSSLPL